MSLRIFPRVFASTFMASALLSAPVMGQSQRVIDAAVADICGNSVGNELGRLLDAGLATQQDVSAAVRIAEEQCDRVYTVPSRQIALVLSLSGDLSAPIEVRREIRALTEDAEPLVSITEVMPRIAALALYYTYNDVAEGETLPLGDTIEGWLNAGGDANTTLCSGASLAELLILARAPRSTGFLAAAGAEFNRPTTYSLLNGRVGRILPEADSGRINYLFGTGLPYQKPFDCVTQEEILSGNLSVYNLALWAYGKWSFTNGHGRAYSAILDAIYAGGGGPDTVTVDVIAAMGTSYLSDQASALEKALATGLNINALSSNNRTLVELAYDGGANSDVLRYLTGLGAKLD